MKKNKIALACAALFTFSSASAYSQIQLTDGVVHTIASSETDDLSFSIVLGQSAANLSIYINNKSNVVVVGDADLNIIDANGKSVDCEVEYNGSSEACVIKSPTAGTYTFEVSAYEAFTDVDIVASTMAFTQIRECINTENTTTVKIQNSRLTAEQIDFICSEIESVEALFHQKLNTGMTAVPNDENDEVDVNIFANQPAFMTTGQFLLNMRDDASTGIYFESNPESANANADVITFEARRWADNEFFVWELTHEYTHYLDGRYNKQGNYSTTTSHDLTWWTEGLAEYIADNDSPYLSVKLAQSPITFTLSEIIKSGYNGDASPYDWGSTAVKFMVEQRPDDMQILRDKARNGQYNELDTWLETWASDNQDAFALWLTSNLISEFKATAQLLNYEDILTTTSQHGKLFYIDVAEGDAGLTVNTGLGGGETLLYVAKDQVPNPYVDNGYLCRSREGSGTEQTCSIETPEAGRYYVLVDAPGLAIFANAQLRANKEYVSSVDKYCSEEVAYTGRDNTQSTAVTLTNKTGTAIKIQWLDNSTGDRGTTVYATLATGGVWTADWSVGDKFVISNESDDVCQSVGTLVSGGNTFELTETGLNIIAQVVDVVPDVVPAVEPPVVEKSSGGGIGFLGLSVLFFMRRFRK
ncbi:MAG: collagenase [Colwellia sp.]|nr:collagenase [Colwellia sp.]